MTLTTESASSFYYWFEPNYFRKYATDLHPIFSIGSLRCVDVCCEIGLRLLKRCCHSNQFLFIQYTFFHQWPMCNKLCAFRYDTLKSTVYEFCWPHQYTEERTLPHREQTSPLGHFPDTHMRRDTTRIASAVLDIGELITLPINNN